MSKIVQELPLAALINFPLYFSLFNWKFVLIRSSGNDAVIPTIPAKAPFPTLHTITWFSVRIVISWNLKIRSLTLETLRLINQKQHFKIYILEKIHTPTLTRRLPIFLSNFLKSFFSFFFYSYNYLLVPITLFSVSKFLCSDKWLCLKFRIKVKFDIQFYKLEIGVSRFPEFSTKILKMKKEAVLCSVFVWKQLI